MKKILAIPHRILYVIHILNFDLKTKLLSAL